MRCQSSKYIIQNTKDNKTKTLHLKKNAPSQDIKIHLPIKWRNNFKIVKIENCIGECNISLSITSSGCSCCGNGPELSIGWKCSNCKHPIPEISLSGIEDIEAYINTDRYETGEM